MIHGFLHQIDLCTRHDPARFLPFEIGGRIVGAVRRDYALLLNTLDGFVLEGESIFLSPSLDETIKRTQAITQASWLLAQHKDLGLDGEIYALIERWGDAPLATIDRLAIPWLGVRGFGVHVNGYVRKKDGVHLWIGKRAASRRVDPCKLDNMIGGGVPLGLSIRENLIKEAGEEAGFSAQDMASAQHVSTLRYKVDKMGGLRDDTLFVFDIELEETQIPSNQDGEVGTFTLIPAQEVAKIVAATDRFKFNCNLVLIDFFLRHGLIEPAPALLAAFAPLRTAEGQG